MAKVDGAASTAEQAASLLAALGRELEGYEARLAAVAGKAVDRAGLSEERLKARIAEVKSEIKRLEPAAKKADKPDKADGES